MFGHLRSLVRVASKIVAICVLPSGGGGYVVFR